MSIKSVLKKILKPTRMKIVGVLAFLALAGGISASVASNASATGTSPQAIDCSVEANNSVIYTGAPSIGSLINSYDNGDGHNVNGSIPNIYDWYSVGGLNTSQKITSAEIHGMSASNTVSGTVTNGNDVYVGTKLVATGAITGGRCNIAGSQTQDSNGTTFYSRPPSVSFLSSSLSALVVMKDGVFQFAVINSCGNAVEATPVPSTPPPPPKVPNYTITKDVSYQGKGWVHQVTAPVDGVVQYKIDVTSTGTAPVTHVFVNDAISSNIQYVPNTLKLNGNPVGDASAKDFFSNGLQIAGLNPGDSTEITFDAKVGVLYTNDNCKPGPYINNAFVNASQLPQKGANAYVEEKCTPPPPPTQNLVCTELSDSHGKPDSKGNTAYNFVGTATPTNAKITSYTFVIKNIAGKTVYTKTVKGGGTKVGFADTLSPDQYNANLTVSGVGNDGKTMFTNITSDGCAKHITVSTTPVCTAPNGSTYPVGSPQCTPATCTTATGQTLPAGSPQCTTCTSPTGQVLPVGSSQCVPTTPPSQLVNTGPGDVIGMFAGASIAGGLGHWYLTFRRARRGF